MSQFEILECKEKERRTYYVLRVKTEGAAQLELVHCEVCKSCDIDSGQVSWGIVSTDPKDLGEAIWDSLAEKALEDLVGAMLQKSKVLQKLEEKER